MKKYILITFLVILVVFSLFFITKNVRENEKNQNKENMKIVTSFYPVYIMTQNIVKDVENIEVVNMAETAIGCIHNYTLTTNDLKKFENADIFVTNGLELEGFLDKIKESYSEIKVIDSSIKIEVEEIEETESEHHKHEINPHIWMSFENYKKQIKEIAEKLSEYDEKNKDKYNMNLENYLEKINKLEEKYEKELSNLSNQTLLTLNESFEYLEENSDFEMISIETDHEESTLSAEKLADIIEDVKEKNIKAVIIDKTDNDKNAQTIIKETGIKLIVLDSAMTGENTLDAYVKIMENNLEILKNI